ncbi:MAG: hypothetical protein ABSE69_11140 [Roseiarcus sp.]
MDGALESVAGVVDVEAIFGPDVALPAGRGTSIATLPDDSTALPPSTLAVSPRLWAPGAKAGGNIVN